MKNSKIYKYASPDINNMIPGDPKGSPDESFSKYLIFDAGPLINFSMNGLLDLFEELHREFKGEFLITKEVKEEIIDTPLKIPRFELEAIRLNELFKKKIIKHADISEKEVNKLREIRENLMQTANNTFFTKGRSLHLIDKGESASLALCLIMKEKSKKEVPLVIDERTTRMLCENPENLRKLFEKKLHTQIKANRENYRKFQGFKVIRSTELAYISYKKGLINLKEPKILEAMLYGLKFRGCSISDKEVEELKGM